MRHEAALAHRSRSRHLDAEVLATASCRANFATYVSLCALLAFATIGQILRSRPNFQSQPACVTVQNVADGLAHHRPRRRNGAPASSSGSGLPPPQLRRNMPTADPSPRSLRRFATIKAKRSSDRRSGNRVTISGRFLSRVGVIRSRQAAESMRDSGGLRSLFPT